MDDITWVRVGHDLFISDQTQNDGMRHPTDDELAALVTLANRCWKDRHPRYRKPDAILDHMRMDNLRMWLIQETLELGTEKQRELWNKGLLSHGELETLARDHLFRHIDVVTEREGIKRWHPIKYSDVPHWGPCAGRVDFTQDPRFDSYDALSQRETTTMDVLEKAIKTTALEHQWLRHSGQRPTGSIIMHQAQCEQCKRVTLYASAKISMPWGDRTFTREYAL